MIYNVILHYGSGDVTLKALGLKQANLLEEMYSSECEVSIVPNVSEYMKGMDLGMVKRLQQIKRGHRG